MLQRENESVRNRQRALRGEGPPTHPYTLCSVQLWKLLLSPPTPHCPLFTLLFSLALFYSYQICHHSVFISPHSVVVDTYSWTRSPDRQLAHSTLSPVIIFTRLIETEISAIDSSPDSAACNRHQLFVSQNTDFNNRPVKNSSLIISAGKVLNRFLCDLLCCRRTFSIATLTCIDVYITLPSYTDSTVIRWSHKCHYVDQYLTQRNNTTIFLVISIFTL